MASSPLTMALLGGQQQDPLYAPAQRKLALGQQFTAEGTSAAPAYPMQALARVLQAGLGGYLMYSGDKDFQDATKQRQADTTNAIQYMRGPQSPLVSAMLPPAQPEMPPRQAPPDIAPIIQQASAKSGVPEGQLTASLAKESGFDPNVVNAQSGAGGMPQILASTAQQPGYGVQPMAPEDRFKPDKAIPFAADYVAARAKAAGLDMTNPEQAARAWSLYGGDSSGKYGKDVVTQAGGGPVSAPPTAPGQPQTGLNAPMVRQAMEMMQRAQEMAAQNPYNVAIQHAAAAQIEQAKVMMGLDQYQARPDGTQINLRTGQAVGAAAPLPHYVNTPTGAEDTTGTHPPTYMPSPRVFIDAHGNTGAVGPGGGVTRLGDNPSGITGNTPESNAMRIIAEVGPKIQSGAATQNEQSAYNIAVEQFRNYKVHTNPTDQSLISVPERGLPPGAPPPAAPGQPPAPDAGGVQKLTPGGAPVGAIDKRYEQFQAAEKTALGARDELQQAQLLKRTLHELGSTGPATPFLANLSRYAAQAGVDQKTLDKFNLPNGATETQAAALANALVMEIARAGFPQRITNNDLQFAQSVKPNPGMPLAAADFLIDNTIVPRAQRDIERYGSVVNLTNPRHEEFDPSLGSLPSKLYEYDQKHPLSSFTPKLQEGATSVAPTQTAQPPVPGAKQAPDGHWYLPDPKRPRKYLQVQP